MADLRSSETINPPPSHGIPRNSRRARSTGNRRLSPFGVLCVTPSRREPLSNVILEAWSLGVPVVAAASEGPSWLIRDGETGLICPVDDAPALSAALSRAIGNTVLRRRIAEGGHAKWRAEFSEDAICRQYLDFFQRLTAPKSRSYGSSR